MLDLRGLTLPPATNFKILLKDDINQTWLLPSLRSLILTPTEESELNEPGQVRSFFRPLLSQRISKYEGKIDSITICATRAANPLPKHAFSWLKVLQCIGCLDVCGLSVGFRTIYMSVV